MWNRIKNFKCVMTTQEAYCVIVFAYICCGAVCWTPMQEYRSQMQRTAKWQESHERPARPILRVGSTIEWNGGKWQVDSNVNAIVTLDCGKKSAVVPESVLLRSARRL